MNRSTHASVSKTARLDNFDPADALESLQTEIAQLEVFAHAAGEAVTRLSPPVNRAERREFDRLYVLVTKLASDAVAVVNHGDDLIAALAAHQEVQ